MLPGSPGGTGNATLLSDPVCRGTSLASELHWVSPLISYPALLRWKRSLHFCPEFPSLKEERWFSFAVALALRL